MTTRHGCGESPRNLHGLVSVPLRLPLIAFDLPHLRSHNAMQGLELAGEGSLPWHDQVKERMSIDTEPFVRFAGISTLFNSAAEGSGQEFVAELEPLTKHDSNLVSWKASETIYMLEKGLTRSCL